MLSKVQSDKRGVQMLMLWKNDELVEVGKVFLHTEADKCGSESRPVETCNICFLYSIVGEDIFHKSVWPKSQLGIWLFVHFASKRIMYLSDCCYFHPLI